MTCEEKLAQLEAENAKLQTELGEALIRVQSAWLAERFAKGRADKAEQESAKAAEVREVLEYWHTTLGRTKRTKISVTGDRGKKVKEALKVFTVEELKLAIDGLKRYPYVWDLGRYKERRPYGTREQRSDDIKSAFYDEKTIEGFIERVSDPEPDERLVQVPARVIDAMKARNDRAVWAAGVWREQAHANDELVASLAAKLDRPKLRLVG